MVEEEAEARLVLLTHASIPCGPCCEGDPPKPKPGIPPWREKREAIMRPGDECVRSSPSSATTRWWCCCWWWCCCRRRVRL